MKILNTGSNKIVSENVIYRKRIRELISGLIPYKYKEGNLLNMIKPKSFKESDSMLFKVKGADSIHTIFMSFPISVFLLDEKLRVVEKKRLNPFEVFIPTKRFSYFLEMVDSKIDEIDVGDVLKIVK